MISVHVKVTGILNFQFEVSKYKDVRLLLMQVHRLPKFYPKQSKINLLKYEKKKEPKISNLLKNMMSLPCSNHLIQNRTKSSYQGPQDPTSPAGPPHLSPALTHKHTNARTSCHFADLLSHKSLFAYSVPTAMVGAKQLLIQGHCSSFSFCLNLFYQTFTALVPSLPSGFG